MNSNNGKSDKHIVVSDNIHKLVMKKQAEFFLVGIRKSMQEIVDMAIVEGIDKIKTEETEKGNLE